MRFDEERKVLNYFRHKMQRTYRRTGELLSPFIEMNTNNQVCVLDVYNSVPKYKNTFKENILTKYCLYFETEMNTFIWENDRIIITKV